MIKKLLFIAAVFITVAVTAQNLTLKDGNDNSIDGLTYYMYYTGTNLSETKFHIANSSGAGITFDGVLTEITNPKATEWQICFGGSCFIAKDGVSTPQSFSDGAAISPAAGIYNDFKVAPFSYPWVAGDFGVWTVKVVNVADANDFSSAFVVWTLGGKPAGDVDGNLIIDKGEIAGDVNENGFIDKAGEILGDMTGNGIIDVWEKNGDANGNGIIDNGEVLSVVSFDENNISFNAYPNPVSNQLNINYYIEGSVNNARVDVYDVLGQKINTYKLNDNKGQLNIDVEHLNSGVYFYTIKVNEKMIRTERVMVK